MNEPRFIDFHNHPDFKTFLSADIEWKRLSCWRKFNMPFLLKVLDFIVFGGILESQSSLNQLNREKGTISLAGLLAYDKGILKAKLLDWDGIHIDLLTIARALKFLYWHKCINPKLIERISSDQSYYCEVFKETEAHLLKSERKCCRYKLLRNINEYDPRKLNIVLTIEGGHNLFQKTSGPYVDYVVKGNLASLKSGGNRYLFMSMVHLEPNMLCTHAYNMKVVRERSLLPEGCGITQLGEGIIKLALSEPGRILIDVKHMSLKSRKQYYKFLDCHRVENPHDNIPVIMSHGCVTGVAFDHMPVKKCEHDQLTGRTKVTYCCHDGHIGGTEFNPCSINLYDEEIAFIIRSKGIIGLNLDEKLLGIRKRKDGPVIEYFSSQEFTCNDFENSITEHSDCQEEPVPDQTDELIQLESEMKQQLAGIVYDAAQGQIARRDLLNELEDLRESFETMQELREQQATTVDTAIKHLCNNILHIIMVGGAQAWRHICIGSDFDGLINPVSFCRDASEFESLSDTLKDWLRRIPVAQYPQYFLSDIDKQVDDIMFRNAYRFLCENFN